MKWVNEMSRSLPLLSSKILQSYDTFWKSWIHSTSIALWILWKASNMSRLSTMKEVYVAKWIYCLRQVITPPSFVPNTYKCNRTKDNWESRIVRKQGGEWATLKVSTLKKNTWKSNDPCKLINDYKQWSLHCKQWSLYTWKLYISLTLWFRNGCLLFLSLSIMDYF